MPCFDANFCARCGSRAAIAATVDTADRVEPA